MIYKQCVLTIENNTATLDEDIYLYRLDKNVELYFTIVNNKYKFDKSDLNNIISMTKASYFQMRLYKNTEVKYTFTIQPTDDGKAILTITDDLIDEPIEVGDYDFQISLLDADKSSMVSMPIARQQLHVCEPLVADASKTGTAILGLSQLDTTGEIVDAFDENGNYIRKVHVNGEIISAELFNKWETALETNTKNLAQVSSQYKDVAKKTDIPDVSTKVDKVAGKGLSTNDYTNEDKQKLQNCISGSNIDSAVSAYLEAHPITGGITATAKNLLIAILRNGVYTSDQSSNITNLVGALSASGGDTPSITYYNITNNLTNCTNGNINSTVEENTSYSCAITANSGYELNTVTVTMGGVDITSTAYSNGNIAISKVTGNIVITATATEKQVVAEMPTNGLVDLFDFRNCEYDNSSTTKIKATKGNGGLYGWFNSGVEKQDAKYGIKSSKTYSYSTDYSTNGASANSSFTQVFMSYFSTNTGNNPLFNPTWGKLSNVGALTFTPAYIDTTDASKKLANENIAGSRGGWIRIILSVDATTKICKLYVNDKCVSTHDGNSITDFKNWATNISMKLLNVNTNGDYYMTQFALYNKALSEVEVTEAMAYLKTLEVA